MKKIFLKLRIYFLIVLVGVLGALIVTLPTAAADLNSLQQQQTQKQQELDAASRAADQKMKEAQNLKSEIAVLDAGIAQIQAAIDQTNFKIDQTQKQINDTQAQIDQKTAELEVQKGNLAEALKVMYESPDQSTIEIIVGANSLSDIINQSQYMDSLEYKVENTINVINQLKADLENKRNELERAKNDLTDLKTQQQAQKKGLDDQKAQKDAMLKSAVSAQKSYQQIIEDSQKALDELDAQISAITGGGRRVSYGHVNQGDIIGHQGGVPGTCGSGYSTGSHLHFGVKLNGSWVNPRSYIGSKLQWPESSFRVTQEFGPADWTWWYVNNFHSGIDMASNSGYGAPVKAAASGDIIINQNDGSFGYGHHIVIDHGGGLLTLYGHLICE